MSSIADLKNLGHAVLAVAKQVDAVERLIGRLDMLKGLYRDDRAFRHLMVTKRLAAKDKMAALRAAFAGSLGALEYEMLQTLLEAEDGAQLPKIAKWVKNAAEADASYLPMTVTASEAMSLEDLSELTRGMEKRLGRSIQATGLTDPSLLGGLKIRLGNTLVDGTLSRRLELVRQELVA